MANLVSELLARVRSWAGPRRISNSDRLADRWRRNLTPQSRVGGAEWYITDVRDAEVAADGGDIKQAARLCSAIRSDGTALGQLQVRYDGVLQLPRSFTGPDDLVAGLHEDFDKVFPSADLWNMAVDGGLLGVIFGEFVDEDGVVVLRRRNPEFLQYVHSEDRWYCQTQSRAREKITPNDGRWVFSLVGGAEHPWRAKAMWRALAKSFISKEHAVLFRDVWNETMAHPAKVAKTEKGSSREERLELLDMLSNWAANAGFVLPAGWDLALMQANVQGYQTFQQSIDSADSEIIRTIAGQTPTAEGGPGFSNTNVHARILGTLIQSDANMLSHVLDEQCIPVWVSERYGWGRVLDSPKVAWDVTPPRDRKAEAEAANTIMSACTAANKNLAAMGSSDRVDMHAVCKTYGIPLTAVDSSLLVTSPD